MNRQLGPLDTANQTSTVGEPSVANVGRQLLLTGNWYASRSLDEGNTWSFVDPFSFFPDAAGGFCCDQTVLHAASHDLTFWLLQYSTGSNNENVLRLAVKRGETMDVDDWMWWDFAPGAVNSQWQGEWFDYNHAAVSDNFLYIVTNVFRARSFTRSVVLRLPLNELAEGASLNFDYFETTESFSLRCTQGATGTMYFGTTQTESVIRVYSWAENDTTTFFNDINITPWSGGNGFFAPCPDGRNWLGRCDPRMTAAWVSKGILGFMWSVDSLGPRSFPHVRVARLNEADLTLLDEPDIWNENFAYAYPDACTNAGGEVGITLFRGGGSLFPGHVVGVWNDTDGAWELQATRNGTHSPLDGKWGDYVTCRRFAPDGNSWLAAGFTLQGGGNRVDIRPLVVRFGLNGSNT